MRPSENSMMLLRNVKAPELPINAVNKRCKHSLEWNSLLQCCFTLICYILHRLLQSTLIKIINLLNFIFNKITTGIRKNKKCFP